MIARWPSSTGAHRGVSILVCRLCISTTVEEEPRHLEMTPAACNFQLVSQSLGVFSMSAPWSSSSLTTSRWPLTQAHHRWVIPWLFVFSISSPRSSSSLTTVSWALWHTRRHALPAMPDWPGTEEVPGPTLLIQGGLEGQRCRRSARETCMVRSATGLWLTVHCSGVGVNSGTTVEGPARTADVRPNPEEGGPVRLRRTLPAAAASRSFAGCLWVSVVPYIGLEHS